MSPVGEQSVLTLGSLFFILLHYFVPSLGDTIEKHSQMLKPGQSNLQPNIDNSWRATQEKEDASLVSKFMAPEQDSPDNLREDNLFEDDEENDTGWVRLRITENSIVKGVRFPKGVIVDVHHEEAEILIGAGKAEIVEVSEPVIDEDLEDGSDTSSEQTADKE